MSNLAFSDLQLLPPMERALTEMGFTTATSIQTTAIPVLRTGVDVTARSQTGTGKTMAFAIPALERIDESRSGIQVLILCPTRELAQQADDEVHKLARFLPAVRTCLVCGGADMDRQFARLRRANLVIGTPGRVMDHMRRGTLRLEGLGMIVLDEADEMLNMGFKEDIETILRDTPPERQTVLFSATLPPAILAIAKEFQRDPQFIEGEQSKEMVAGIVHSYVDAPAGRKTDALTLLLRYHRPNRAILFCNTKSMVDELTEHLNAIGFSAEALHGDLKQAQRNHVMSGFKKGRVTILVATDIAARGIDVSDVDYVINYDIPQMDDYYVHRIGRTGRAGKTGSAITICCGKRQTVRMKNICRRLKAELHQDSMPTPEDIRLRDAARNLDAVAAILTEETDSVYEEMTAALLARGYTAEQIAAAALQLHFQQTETAPEALPVFQERHEGRSPVERLKKRDGLHGKTVFCDVIIDIGSANRVAPNHLVGAITERSGLSGKQIGKIEISPEFSVVAVPIDCLDQVISSMEGCKVCGKPTHTLPLSDLRPRKKERPYANRRTKSTRFGGQKH